MIQNTSIFKKRHSRFTTVPSRTVLKIRKEKCWPDLAKKKMYFLPIPTMSHFDYFKGTVIVILSEPPLLINNVKDNVGVFV